MFSSTKFKVSGLTLKSLIHFDFTFVKGERNLILLDIQFVEEAVFSLTYAFSAFVKNPMAVAV
jgi:hypothetical protein